MGAEICQAQRDEDEGLADGDRNGASGTDEGGHSRLPATLPCGCRRWVWHSVAAGNRNQRGSNLAAEVPRSGLEGDIGVHHHPDERVEIDLRHPSKFFPRFARVADQQIDLGGAEKRGSIFTYFRQSSPACAKATSTSSPTEWVWPVAMT